jgi:hypothetical protein
MTKKEYMKPSMKVVKLQYKCQILVGSTDAYGMNKRLVIPDDEDDWVDEGW